MNIYLLLLGLLCVGVSGQKRIKLEDIEGDNLRAEGISKTGGAEPDEPKYRNEPEDGRQRYRVPSGPTSASIAYVTPSPARNEHSYQQQQQNAALPEQILPSSQYYNDYRYQTSLPLKGISPNIYESQRPIYQPEVNVGNHLQAVRQSTVTEEYARAMNKGTVYVDLPMMHLLAYYPNLDVGFGRSSSGGSLLSVPLYTSTFGQKAPAPAKPVYRVPYTVKYSSDNQDATYSGPAISKRYRGSALLNVPYASQDQSPAQGRYLLYTQAYVVPSQPRYVSQVAHAQPSTVYLHAPAPAYVRDNSLHGSANYAVPPEQLESPTRIADEQPDRIPSQHAGRQLYAKEAEEPSGDLVPPEVLAAQDFQTGTDPLEAPASPDEEATSEQNGVEHSEPRSLLDSYVPSKLIVAQDAARYRERPIKLESGFLPSKENFAQKKRKTN